MKWGTHCGASARLFRTCARLACGCALAAYVAGCAGVRVDSFPPPETCLTGEDVEFIAQLLGEQAVGRNEERRLELQGIVLRLSDSAAYCEVADERLRRSGRVREPDRQRV